MKKYLSIFILSLLMSHAYGFGVDLHAHLFMEKGVKLIYSGNFFSPHIRARKWSDARRSQVNEKILAQSELSIVVVSLYAAPILAGRSMFQSILKQIDMAKTFVKRNPEWVIAKSSEEARMALQKGKRVLILSIEGADYFVNSLAQLKKLHDLGVRIITLLHLTRDRIGAPAFLHWSEAIFSTPGAYWYCYNRDENYIKINCSGLTNHGEQVSNMLADAGVWIDLAHASDKSLEFLIPMHYKRNIPLLYTHGSLRSKLKQERGVSNNFLAHYQKLGGMFGLTPSPKFLGKKSGKPKKCQGTIEDFKEHYDILLTYLSSDQIAVGSDTNGMIEHLRPRNKRSGCNYQFSASKFDANGGWWNFSHTLPLYEELKNMNSDVPSAKKIVERFLYEWSRIEKAARPWNIWGPNSPYQNLRR